MEHNDNNIRYEMLLSDTSVPDVFIVCHMQELTGDTLKFCLWLMMTYGTAGKFTLESVKDYSYLNPSEASEAIAELIAAGLVYKSGDDAFCLTDLKQKEALDFAKAYAAKGVNIDGLELSADAKARDVLAASISKTFYLGKAPYWSYRLIDKCLYEYNFEAPVVYKLFEEGRDGRFHVSTPRMESLAKDWYNRGYTSSDKLGEYYDHKTRVRAVTEKMGKLLRRRINGLDMERIERWVKAMDVTPDLAAYAFRCNEFRGNVTLKNVEDTLNTWYELGIKTPDKAMVYENERHQENKSKSRKMRGKDNLWKTGAEAGLLKQDKEKNGEKADPVKNDADDKTHDVILDLFGE